MDIAVINLELLSSIEITFGIYGSAHPKVKWYHVIWFYFSKSWKKRKLSFSVLWGFVTLDIRLPWKGEAKDITPMSFSRI